EENDAVHEAEGVAQHQLLQLAVVNASPVRTGQKRPPDFDLAALAIVTVVARRSDDAAGRAVEDGKRPAGFQRLAKEGLEDVLGEEVPELMVLPDRRVGGNGVQRVEVVRSKRPEFHEPAGERGLKVESL